MEFTISRNALQQELGRVQRIVERKTTIPILSQILIESVGENTIRITATDLDITLRCDAEVENIIRPGSLLVPSKKLADLARLLPDAPVHFKKEDNGWVSVKCGTSSFKLPAGSRDSWPELPQSKSVPIKIPSAVIKDFIGRSIFAITQEESRYTLSGAKFELDAAGAKMVTTDGHRLAFMATREPIPGLGTEKIDALIPRKALAEMSQLVRGAEGDVLMGADENHIYFEVGPRLLISCRLSGQFPNYEMVIPKNNDKTIILDRRALEQAIRLVGTMSDERNHSIRLRFNSGSLTLSAQAAEMGEGQQVLEVNYSGPEVSIGFNSQYLEEFLGVIGSEKIAIDFKDGNSQALLRPVEDAGYDCKYVVMPMRI